MPEEERIERREEQEDGPIVEKKMYVFKKFGDEEEHEENEKLKMSANETPDRKGEPEPAEPENKEDGEQV